jgi:hypothetical protein
VRAVELLNAEWAFEGRTPHAREALAILAQRDETVARLSEGPCPDPVALVAHMKTAPSIEGARVIAAMLREADAHPFVRRILLQALVGGLTGVAKRLRYGEGGGWACVDDFYAEMISVTWEVLVEWTGVDRPYAVMDLLSAVRCRLRRQLFREKDRVAGSAQFRDGMASAAYSFESDLEVLARELDGCDLAPDDVDLLFDHLVMGFSIADLAAERGVNRTSLGHQAKAAKRELVA